jgi:hypothetical protein
VGKLFGEAVGVMHGRVEDQLIGGEGGLLDQMALQSPSDFTCTIPHSPAGAIARNTNPMHTTPAWMPGSCGLTTKRCRVEDTVRSQGDGFDLCAWYTLSARAQGLGELNRALPRVGECSSPGVNVDLALV